MKHKLNLRTQLIVICFTFPLLSGCKKIIDYISKANIETRTCQISEILISNEISHSFHHYRFTYNDFGDPVKIFDDTRPQGNYWFFKYDKFHRLIESLSTGDSSLTKGIYSLWSKYHYNILNQIVDETQYFSGLKTETGPVPSQSYNKKHYEYDGLNRIDKETDTSYYNHHTSYWSQKRYVYESNGNLRWRLYDDKVNILRTNKIWMFLVKDYSLNNAFKANEYNEHQLPLKIYFPREFMDFLMSSAGNIQVKYDCQNF